MVSSRGLNSPIQVKIWGNWFFKKVVFYWFIGLYTYGRWNKNLNGLIRIIRICVYLLCKSNIGVWRFPGVLEGLGSSWRLVGLISTHPGTSSTLWCEIMTKILRGNFFFHLPYRIPWAYTRLRRSRLLQTAITRAGDLRLGSGLVRRELPIFP